MSNSTVNLVKLCVGVTSADELETWQHQRAEAARKQGREYAPYHTTRMWPKRASEILNGGSLYWVFKGFILARQEVLCFTPQLGEDGITRCTIVMSKNIIRTQAVPRRPFQGWRYLAASDSPPDLSLSRVVDDEIPIEMNLALAEIGLH